MGTPAIVMNDRITGTCPLHVVPNPTSGVPQPGPPMPFSAPILVGVVPTVLIGGKPAAVVGCTGINTPPHVGLHPMADPFFAPPAQIGTVVAGSTTVLIGGTPAATGGGTYTLCATPGTVVPTVMNVLIG
jgi:uncharacterized Zn-binding protein involved in type VI secretion